MKRRQRRATFGPAYRTRRHPGEVSAFRVEKVLFLWRWRAFQRALVAQVVPAIRKGFAALSAAAATAQAAFEQATTAVRSDFVLAPPVVDEVQDIPDDAWRESV